MLVGLEVWYVKGVGQQLKHFLLLSEEVNMYSYPSASRLLILLSLIIVSWSIIIQNSVGQIVKAL